MPLQGLPGKELKYLKKSGGPFDEKLVALSEVRCAPFRHDSTPLNSANSVLR